jgi:hypothetical protein
VLICKKPINLIRRNMATFRKGKELIQKTAAGSGGRRFTPNIYWKPGDVRVIAFLTEADEIPKVRLHQMVNIPDDSREKGIRYETFLCRKDPSMAEEYGGECELCDRVGADAAEKFVALAIELEPTRKGKRVESLAVKYDTVKRKKDDGTEEEVEYPRWGLVIQASKNFFSYFAAYDEANGDIREVAWEIHREGGGTDTKYHPFMVMNGPNAVALPDLSEVVDAIPTLEELLEAMGTEEKYAEVSDLAAGSQPTFGNKKSTDSGTVPSGERETEFAKIKADVVGSY